MDDHKKLIEELRARPNPYRTHGCENCDESLKDQAATALEGLVGERDELRAFVQGDLAANFVEQGQRIEQSAPWKARATAAEASLKELREAKAAIDFAMDHVHGVTDCYLFLDDWREGDVSSWPEWEEFKTVREISPPDTAASVSSRSLGEGG